MPKEEIARFYTRSRRFPKMIGRMHDGSRIPGGPYTLTQAGFGGAALMSLLLTRSLWSSGAILLDVAITAGITWGVTWAVGLIPMTRRSLASAFVDAVGAMFRPYGGRYQERPVRLTRPHQAIGAAKMPVPVTAPAEAEVDVVDPVEAAEASASRVQPIPPAEPSRALARPAVSAVERLLQQAKNND